MARRCESATHWSSRARREKSSTQSRRRSPHPRHDGGRARGEPVATIKKALVTPLRDRYSIEVEGDKDLEAKGNIVDHEFKIERDGEKVAEVSKRWFRVRDTYGIEVAPGQETR